jgi:hypothetical protein
LRQVMDAATAGNFARFFALYGTAPNMGSYVMDFSVHAMRLKALTAMAKGYAGARARCGAGQG